MRAARESSYGVVATGNAAFPGAPNGPLGATIAVPTGMVGTPALWGPGAGTALVNTMGLPVTSKEVDPMHARHFSPMILGRRYEDISVVPGRRQVNATFNVPVTPDAFGFWLFMTLGADAVTATTGNGGACALNALIAANATSMVITTLANNLSVGQRIFFRDTTSVGGLGTNPEYATVSVAASSGATVTVNFNGGAGTAGGVKFGHAISTLVEFGPWTHTFTPVNTPAGTPSFQIEDNEGGIPTSKFFTGMVIDSMDLSMPIEKDADPFVATVKAIGTSVNPSGSQTNTNNTIASPNVGGAFQLPVEEVPTVPGNFATFSASPTGGGPSNVDATNLNPVTAGGVAPKIYVPDFKVNLTNKAQLAKAQNSSPDPYAAIFTNFACRGTMETLFEDYSVFYDYVRTQLWQGTQLVVNWGAQNLVGTTGAQSSVFTLNIFNFAIEKTGKSASKSELVYFPVDAWRAVDNGPNTAKNFTTLLSAVLTNNVAAY